MPFDHVCLESIVCSLPDDIVTSAELEQQLAPLYERFNLHVGRLELMSGIAERRFWPRGAPPSAGSTQAGQMALSAADVPAADIDFLIHTSVSRDFLEPATASVVHRNLGLPAGAGFFDISNACLGFLNGIMTLGDMIELGHIRRGIVVAGESSRQLVESTIAELLAGEQITRQDLKQAIASLTIGSGAAAAVLAHRSVATATHRVVGGIHRSATVHNDLCRGSADTGFAGGETMLMNTDSETLLAAGCALAAETWPRFKEAVSWSDETIQRCCTHQVGVAHRQRLYEAIDRDPAGDFTTLEFLGNVGSVSVPATLALGIERQPPVSGERIALLGIGSGLCCMMLGLEW